MNCCGSSTGGSSSGWTEMYKSFMARLPQLPAYQRLLAEGAALSKRLSRQLPPELAAASAADKRAAEGQEALAAEEE